MFQSFYPSENVESVYDYDFEAKYREGYRAIIFDIDNTIVVHKTDQTPQSLAFLTRLRDIGFGILFLSNGCERRVKSFADPVGMKYLYRAGKPNPKSYQKAMEILGTNADNTLFFGDQLFTDILGANRAGIHSVLVKPISRKEDPHIILKRPLERVVLAFYRRNRRLTQASSMPRS